MKKIWNHLEEGILLITFPLMTIITIAGTAVRYFELGTLTWSEESARYLMIVAAFAGIAIGFRENSHLGLSFFIGIIPKKLKPFFSLIRFILTLIFAVLMTFLSGSLVMQQMNVSQFSAAMHLPMWIVYVPMFLGFILMIVRIIQAYIKHKEFQEEVV